MNLNDQLHFYLTFDLPPFPLKPRDGKSCVRGANEHDPHVGELQRSLAVAPTNTDTPGGKELAFLDSALILTSSLAFSANSRSPPVGNLVIIPA